MSDSPEINSFDEFDPPDFSGDFNEDRLDIEWITLNAVREMLGIALRGRPNPTYEQALAFGAVLSPQLFGPDSSLISQAQEPPIVTEYRQRAELESNAQGIAVNPLDILDKEISYYSDLTKSRGDKDRVQARLQKLMTARVYFIPKSYTENQLILRDVFKADRNIPLPPFDADTYREYQLQNDRVIRIRLLHPDPPEHSIGADLIYETYWEKKHLARLSAVQYKIWNGKTLYLSQSKNLEQQLDKLKSVFCDNGFCKAFEGSSRSESYRLPYCAAFLRPTNKLQEPNSRLMSVGLHVPICVVRRSFTETNQGGKKIERKTIRSEALSQKVFEEILNANMLGSRWFTYDEIQKFYTDHKLLDSQDKVILHVQEFGAQKSKKRTKPR